MKIKHLLAITFTASLTACGGGGGNSTGATGPNTTPTTKPTAALTQGMVTGFGSVIVNGVHYDVKDADIDVDGDSKVESDVNVGDMVRITGTIDADGRRGKATRLYAESQLRGPIDSIDLTTGILVALGQTILINADTFYPDGLTAANLVVGDVIRVCSYTNADGQLVATRVAVKTGIAANDMLLTGVVSNLDTTAMTFSINAETINYANATLNDLLDKTLSNGMRVRVHGRVIDTIFVAVGNVHASRLDLKHDRDIDVTLGVEMGGLVTNLIAGTRFSIGEVTVIINSETQFDGGTAADLANDMRVRVHGKFDANHNLVAKKIKLNFQPRIEDEGLITAIDLAAQTFVLNGMTFEVTLDTSTNDRSDSDVRLFSLSDLAVGDFVDVRGYKIVGAASDHIIATRIERHNHSEHANSDFKVEVSGVIESLAEMTLTIAGHNIRITNNTELVGFESLPAFLAAAVGLRVEVKGIKDGELLVARVIKRENEHEESHTSSQHSAGSEAAEHSSELHESQSSHSAASENHSARASESHASTPNEIHSSAPSEIHSTASESESSRATTVL
jgi:hypothetical protein